MIPSSSYQPFLIGQGNSNTGLFTYLDSWIKPENAYDTLINAYVYRGSLYQRYGMTLFPSTPAAGALVYADSSSVATIAGGPVASYAYNSTTASAIAKLPIIAGSVILRTRTSAGVETFTDNGAGVLTGSLGDTGTINYTNGQWSVTLGGGRTIATGVKIWATYSYVPTNQTPTVNNPIMGIKQFINENGNNSTIVVMDTKRACYWNSATRSFAALNTFSQQVFRFPDPNALTAPAINPILTRWSNITPFSVTLSDDIGNSLVDDGVGGFIQITAGAQTVNTGTTTINYTNGQLTLNYNTAPTAGTTVTLAGSLQGNYFTGDNTNFFNATNWDASLQSGYGSQPYLYFTNNVDPITIYDGTNLSRPAFGLYKSSVTLKAPSQVLLAYRNDIETCLDIKVYQNRLLLLRPKIYLNDAGHTLKSTSENQAIYYSCSVGSLSFTPTNFVIGTEIAGNGGYLPATTGDILQSSQLIRDVLVVFFTNSTWIFRNTGSPIEPFRFYQLNVSRSTNAPYGSAPYDEFATSMGAKGLIACDAVGVERYDEPVVDLFENINQNYFKMCFAQKYDNQNQTWMLYPSVDNQATTSDRIFVYNYLENTWAIYIPNLGSLIQTPTSNNTLSCLGLGFTTQDATWNTFAVGGTWPNGLNWDQANFRWDNFLQQDLTPSLLAGDQNGFVYVCDDGPVDSVGPQGTTPLGIPTQVVTKRLNPFISQAGQKCSFGYVDIYYQVIPDSQIRVNIYGNNNTVLYKSFTFTMDGDSDNDYAWKRFYINVTAEFIQIELNSYLGVVNGLPSYNQNGPFKILGMILWAAPAGRLTPGTYL